MGAETLGRGGGPLGRDNHLVRSNDDHVVRDIDRVAAMGGGSRLGGLLFRFTTGGQAQWGHQIVTLLANRVMRAQKIGRGSPGM